MSADSESVRTGSIESLPSQPRPKVISEELGRIAELVHGVAPADSVISFSFDKSLHVHIDVRKLEDVTRLEAVLPTLGAGLFSEIQRGSAPHHSFFHRLSALVDR